MKNTSHKSFMQFMYWFFRIAFWLQLTGVALLLVLNYFMYNSQTGLYFSIRGNFYAQETQLKPNKDLIILDSIVNKTPTSKIFLNQFNVVTMNTKGVKTIYYLYGHRNGFIRIDSTDFSKAFTFKNIAWTICDILIILLWLLVTYQIMKILQSLKNKSVFIHQNIKRIRFIGWSFILIPFVQLARDQLFFLVIRQHLKIPGFTFVSNFRWTDLLPFSLYSSFSYDTMNHPLFPSIALGLIILVIVQIFKNGFELQKDNDLTI